MALFHERKSSKFEDLHLKIRNLLETELIVPENQRITTIFRHQIEATLATMRYFIDARNRGGLVQVPPALIVCPTGAGKSGIITLLPYALNSRKVLVLSPSPIISEQLRIAFGGDGLYGCFYHKVGLINSDEQLLNCVEDVKIVRDVPDIRGMFQSNLVIVNAQKFGGNSRMSLTNNAVVEDVARIFSSFQTIIVDEAHHYPATTWHNIVANFADKEIIFLTATPYRQNEPILPNQVVTYNIGREAIEGAIIRRSQFVPLDIIGTEAQIMNHVNAEIQVSLDMHNAQVPGVVHKALILVQGMGNAEAYTRYFANSTYYTSERRTEGNRKNFEAGHYRILILCGKLLEGYDNNTISVCVILRGVKSNILFSQFIGRCLRVSGPYDPVVAKVISVNSFGQQSMWNDYLTPRIAEVDPRDEEE